MSGRVSSQPRKYLFNEQKHKFDSLKVDSNILNWSIKYNVCVNETQKYVTFSNKTSNEIIQHVNLALVQRSQPQPFHVVRDKNVL